MSCKVGLFWSNSTRLVSLLCWCHKWLTLVTVWGELRFVTSASTVLMTTQTHSCQFLLSSVFWCNGSTCSVQHYLGILCERLYVWMNAVGWRLHLSHHGVLWRWRLVEVYSATKDSATERCQATSSAARYLCFASSRFISQWLSHSHCWALSVYVKTIVYYCKSVCASCLQCFDTVGWAAGRASGL